MKYIFTVHSPITFFAAVCIIEKEEINKNDVIIITSDYKVPISIGLVVPSYRNWENNFIKKILNLNLPLSYDRYLNNITGGDNYVAYVDLMHSYQRILVTHVKCLAFHFMEEGTASYILPNKLHQLAHISGQVSFRENKVQGLLLSLWRVIRGNTLSLLSLPYHPQAYAYFASVKFYTFSSKGYPGIDPYKKVILQPSQGNREWAKVKNNHCINNALIWIEESYPSVFGIKNNQYRDAIILTVEYLKKNYQLPLYVKLRPNQNVNDSLVINTLKGVDIDFNILPKDIVAEALFIRSSDLIVIGIVSSLLFYARIFGHKAISFFELLEGKPETAFDTLDCYWEEVEKIAWD